MDREELKELRRKEKLSKKRAERRYRKKLRRAKAKRRAEKRRRIKEKERALRKRKTVCCKIILMRNGKTQTPVGRYYTLRDGYDALGRLKEESEKVVFPVRIFNTGRGKNAIYEYVLFERSGGEKKDAVLKNEYGKLVAHRTNSNKWNIVDKVPVDMEETFWVYGYDQRYDRKTFSWIYEHLVKERISMDGFNFVSVILFGNKMVFKYDDGSMGLVMCKTISDGVRFYNKLMEFILADKIDSRVLLLGSIRCKRGVNSQNEMGNRLRDEICDLTGWDKHKLARMNTMG